MHIIIILHPIDMIGSMVVFSGIPRLYTRLLILQNTWYTLPTELDLTHVNLTYYITLIRGDTPLHVYSLHGVNG